MSDDGDCSDLICRRRVQAVDKSGIEATTGPYGVRMRWAALFADMELQLDAADARGRDQTVADLTRAERASVRLADRVRACVGGDVRLVLRDGPTSRTVPATVVPSRRPSRTSPPTHARTRSARRTEARSARVRSATV